MRTGTKSRQKSFSSHSIFPRGKAAMTRILAAAALAAFALAACDTVTKGTPAGPIATACEDNLGLGEGVCACIERKAAGDLSDDAYDFLAASLSGDNDRANGLQRDLSVSEATAASMIMVTAPAACMSEG